MSVEHSNKDDFRDTLYTVDNKGNRKWVYSEIVNGFWQARRKLVAYFLIGFYLITPWLRVSGKQAVLIDIPQRRFIFWGAEFWATDSFFLFLILGSLAFSLFFFTAVFGRVWCGWACPETVFLEFLFRPIERLIEGNASQRKRLDQAAWNLEKILKKALKHFLCAFFAWIIASSALAYFIGAEPLIKMMSDWPTNNPVPFVMTLVMMGLMAFQFGWFREQFCTVLCPYARFQSVLMDSSSLVVGYDVVRGEPRGKGEGKGDCIDCKLCVRVCPTGIDIRNGLQLECVACTACVDACDSIMSKLGKASGLVRYDTEDRLLGRSLKRNLLRPRPFVYGAILTIFFFTFVYRLVNRQSFDFQIVRAHVPFSMLTDQHVSNQYRLSLSNKTFEKRIFKLSIENQPNINLVIPLNPIEIKGHDLISLPVFVHFPKAILNKGQLRVSVLAEDSNGVKAKQDINLLGPE